MVLKESEAGKVSQQPWRMFRSKNTHTWNRAESTEQWGGSQLVHPWDKPFGVFDWHEEVRRRQDTKKTFCFLTTLKICTDSKVLSHKAARDLQKKRWQCKMDFAQIFIPQGQAVNLDRQPTCYGMCMTSSLLTSLDSMSFIQGMHGRLPPWSRLIVFPRIPPHLSPFRYHLQ